VAAANDSRLGEAASRTPDGRRADADGGVLGEPAEPLFVHRLHETVCAGGCPPGHLRTMLRDLSPNDLHVLRQLSPPLELAVARTGCPAEMLLLRHEFGFDWGRSYGDVGCCLHAAAAAGNMAVLELLVAYCPDEIPVETPTATTARTALHVAAGCGRADAVCMLIDVAGADVHARDKSGDTSLHVACRGQHGGAAAALLERGADRAAMNRRGHAPWTAAVEACDLDLLRSVYTPASGPTAYLTAAQHAAGSAVLNDQQTMEVLRVLHALGEQLGTTSVTGVDVYHLALRKGKPMAADFVASVVPPVQVVPLPFR
jgi:hypothetical protein